MFHKSHCDPLSATSHCTYSHHHAISGHLPSKVLTSRAESLSTCLSVDNCGQNSTETGSWGILPQARLVLWGPLTGLDELLIRPTWKRGEIRRCLLNLIFFFKETKQSSYHLTFYRWWPRSPFVIQHRQLGLLNTSLQIKPSSKLWSQFC